MSNLYETRECIYHAERQLRDLLALDLEICGPERDVWSYKVGMLAAALATAKAAYHSGTGR